MSGQIMLVMYGDGDGPLIVGLRVTAAEAPTDTDLDAFHDANTSAALAYTLCVKTRATDVALNATGATTAWAQGARADGINFRVVGKVSRSWCLPDGAYVVGLLNLAGDPRQHVLVTAVQNGDGTVLFARLPLP